MAAIAFDPLEYARALESSGVPREQAEVHAKAMTQVFVHNMDALVTRDYLDTRFTEFETRIEAKMDRRFAQVDARFAEMEVRFARINVMLGVILVAVAIPVLQTLLTWVS
ncbi:hypothetical protein F0M18_17115 [Pseudohalioglobus sediminis]|uniref:DUF1640 domain-containing protein n=1 Tax=Pseudohalioglobus sediminis TaxID=2606449 RepID=A0A5B0WPR0_9GAMM|nr:hypothetical protein [Pseudohalioglobus sediminis]KAA1188923.1 hypothetical protein F0M18_17115 [Pseudohalioglobus sediminis]